MDEIERQEETPANDLPVPARGYTGCRGCKVLAAELDDALQQVTELVSREESGRRSDFQVEAEHVMPSAEANPNTDAWKERGLEAVAKARGRLQDQMTGRILDLGRKPPPPVPESDFPTCTAPGCTAPGCPRYMRPVGETGRVLCDEHMRYREPELPASKQALEELIDNLKHMDAPEGSIRAAELALSDVQAMYLANLRRSGVDEERLQTYAEALAKDRKPALRVPKHCGKYMLDCLPKDSRQDPTGDPYWECQICHATVTQSPLPVDDDPDPLIVGQLKAAERYYNDLGDLHRGSVMYGAWREIERLDAENEQLRADARRLAPIWADYSEDVEVANCIVRAHPCDVDKVKDSPSLERKVIAAYLRRAAENSAFGAVLRGHANLIEEGRLHDY